ncbi:Eco57I restriction-modification methylase domain-containing protein [Nocardia colli]|uniref:Eco57I restriction-modification methylase domain-containing protein n=1 Tax=Nocardia colli TaxID=2545717 RepID=UPI0035E3A835
MDNVKRLVETFAASEAYYTDPVYKESDTRSEFIDPLLHALGWDVSNAAGVAPHLKDVMREESQQQEDAAVKFPDYTLRIAGRRRMFLEAKKPSVDITSHMESIRQVRRYGYTGADPIAVLTNFRDLTIYDTSFAITTGDQPATGRIYRWHYTEFESKFEDIRKVIGQPEAAAPSWPELFMSKSPRQPVPADREFVNQFNEWRLLLGRDLYEQDNRITEEDLNDAVQRVLNRLIFVRMCEDRGIEGERTLRDAIRGGTTTIAALLNRLHRRYNTGLFDSTAAPLATKVRGQVLNSIVTHLYAPQSPFSFAVLNAAFLGLVYEASLAEHLIYTTSSGHTEVLLKKKREYEHREVVTTPQLLVDSTVRAALDALHPSVVEPKSLDFAVGSGRFLLSLFDRLIDAETGRQAANSSKALMRTGIDEYRLPFEEKRRLLVDNLFGIDIDYNAVEVAKFSLLVRLLQDENRYTLPPAGWRSILPDLSNNIIWGNTLVHSLPAGTSSEQRVLTRPLDLSTTALPAQFDLCVGNPPYMTPEKMMRFDKVEHEYLKKNYATAFQQFDKYFMFIEFAAQYLAPDGILAAVIPNKWMTLVAGAGVRMLLRTTLSIVRLDNFREAQLFPGKTIYVCSLIARKRTGEHFLYSEPVDLRPRAAEDTGYFISSTNLPMSVTEAWILPTTIPEAKALSAIAANSIPLSDVVEPKNGIQTSAERDETYLVTNPIAIRGGSLRWVDKFGVTNEVEKVMTRPFLKDSTRVKSWHEILPDKRIIFPYQPTTASPSGWEIIPPEVMRSVYPKTYAYLLAHEAELQKRVGNASELRKAFYAYGRTQAIPYASSAPKILYSVNQRGDKYGLDQHGIVYASGGTAGEVALYPKDTSYDLDFILGLLAQPPIELFLRKRGSVFRGGYYARGTDVIRDAPIPNLNFTRQRDRQFHDDVVTAVRNLRALHRKTSSITQRSLPQHNAALAAATTTLQALFNQRWGLTAQEVTALGI